MYKKSPSASGSSDNSYNAKGEKSERSFEKKPFKKFDGPRDGERKEGYKKRDGQFSSSRRENEGSAEGKRDFKRPGKFDDRSGSDRPAFKPRSGGDGPGGDRRRSSDGEKPYRDRNADRGDRPSYKPRGGGDGPGGDKRRSSDGDKPYRERNADRGDRPSFKPRSGGDAPGGDRRRTSDGEKPYRDRGGDRSERPSFKPRNSGETPQGDRPYKERSFDRGDKPFKGNSDRKSGDRYSKDTNSDRPFNAGKSRDGGAGFPGMPMRKKSREDFKRDVRQDDAPRPSRPSATRKFDSGDAAADRDAYKKNKEREREYYGDDDEWEPLHDKKPKAPVAASYPMPLNKYIAHSGECSRRDAAELVKQGKAKVNGELVIDPGQKVNEGDQVTLSGKKLAPQKGMVYLLLNKPKGFITTNEDERGRKTVMDLVASANVGRVYPVGRLDRATTGLILLTNDGDIAQKLAHPSYDVKKVYHVTLDKQLTKADFDKIIEGITLDDGEAIVDEMAFLENKNEVGLEIHNGKNRIVRRIFESLGYVVEKLDRVVYAGLTKKNLPRGKWRFLNDREIVLLKHFKS